MALQLVIGNKNYSSWSMRPWVLMTQLGIPFEELKLRSKASRERKAKEVQEASASAGMTAVEMGQRTVHLLRVELEEAQNTHNDLLGESSEPKDQEKLMVATLAAEAALIKEKRDELRNKNALIKEAANMARLKKIAAQKDRELEVAAAEAHRAKSLLDEALARDNRAARTTVNEADERFVSDMIKNLLSSLPERPALSERPVSDVDDVHDHDLRPKDPQVIPKKLTRSSSNTKGKS